MSPSHLAHATLLVLVVAAPRSAAEAGEPVRLQVEFTPDGRCLVAASAANFHANIAYAPPAGPGGLASASGPADLRCGVPGTPKGQAVDLAVLLPPGVAPASGGFPRLRWERRADRWVGRALLPAAPAFVRVPREGGRAARFASGVDVTALVATALGLLWTLAYGKQR